MGLVHLLGKTSSCRLGEEPYCATKEIEGISLATNDLDVV